MTKRKKAWAVATVLLILLALIIYFITKLPIFDTIPLSGAVSMTKTDYSARNVNTEELEKASEQLNLLMQKPKYENEEDIKAVLAEADSIINRIDIEDPTIEVSEDKEKATVALTEVQKALDLALSHFSMEKAEVTVERIDLGVLAQGGTVGDVLSITPQVYPTFIKDSVLDWGSSDESVAVVNENGDISLVGAGTATITVTENHSGTMSSVEITVSAPVVKPPVTPVQKPTTPAPTIPKTETPAQQGGNQGGTGGGSGGSGKTGPEFIGEYDRESFNESGYGNEKLDSMTQEEIRDAIAQGKGWR